MSRNETIFHAHLFEGVSFPALADRFDITPSRVVQVFQNVAREHVSGVQSSLELGRDQNQPYVFLPVPEEIQGDHAAIFQYVRWLLIELDKRGRRIEVHYGLPEEDGCLPFALEDVT
jgi:hypothetical protein